MITWRDEIKNALQKNGETKDDVVSIVLEKLGYPDKTEIIDIDFAMKLIFPRVCNFAMWTKKRVYFLATYDGDYWIESVPRNPDGKVIWAIGG